MRTAGFCNACVIIICCTSPQPDVFLTALALLKGLRNKHSSKQCSGSACDSSPLRREQGPVNWKWAKEFGSSGGNRRLDSPTERVLQTRAPSKGTPSRSLSAASATLNNTSIHILGLS